MELRTEIFLQIVKWNWKKSSGNLDCELDETVIYLNPTTVVEGNPFVMELDETVFELNPLSRY